MGKVNLLRLEFSQWALTKKKIPKLKKNLINLGQGPNKNQLEPHDFALIDRAITPEERRRFSGEYSN